MGAIKPEVESSHLSQYLRERAVINLFTRDFDITWARRRRAFNTELSIYFVKPEKYMEDLFGFDGEILLAYSDFNTLEPRSMQIVESFLNDDPAKGRVLQSIFFLVSKDENSAKWISEYVAKNPQSRVPVVFIEDDIRSNSPHDNWYIRNIISSQLYSRDLFDYQLPIDNDLYFFGRDSIIASYIDSIAQCKNIGLFGLRKTGKTSVLYKIRRIFEREKMGCFVYFDAKLPSIRQKRWYELLQNVIDEIKNKYLIKIDSNVDEKNVSDIFLSVLGSMPKNEMLCLVFDEIEYISPIAILDTHWRQDFIPFWQTLWSAQSQIRKLSNVIAGVNPSVSEIDNYDGIQNPMFGVIPASYLRGLEEEDLRKMLHFFGKRMGLKFTAEASRYLWQRYGGHPLLTRLACSQVHSFVKTGGSSRPIDITKEFLEKEENNIENEIQFYCRHVVSELKQFYPDEYVMLELLSSSQTIDFIELSADPDLIRHLNNYGLVSKSSDGKPRFAIPVIGRYIGLEYARREKSSFQKFIIPHSQRQTWVGRRVISIIKEMRTLENYILKESTLPKLYGESSLYCPEALIDLQPCITEDDFSSFLNKFHKSFVEKIEVYGKSIGNKHYFWKDVKQAYPVLWDALNRIKAYRNGNFHIVMTPSAEHNFQHYLSVDLEGKRVAQVHESWFRLQQCVLDELLTGIIVEINKIS